MSLRPQERARVTRLLSETVRGLNRPMKVISGVSAEGCLEATNHALAAKEAGADAVLLMPPHHWLRFGRTHRTAIGFIEDVAEAVDIPLILHQYPAWTKAIRLFVRAVAVILFASAAAKIVSLFGRARILIEGALKRHLLPGMVLSGMLLLCEASGETQGFKVAGTMSYWESSGAGLQQKDTWDFEASVLGSNWLQATHLSNGQHFIHGSDGSNVFWLFQNGAERKKFNLRAYSGTLFRGSYPIQATSIYSTLPWLAYCSAYFMNAGVTNGEIIMPAPWLSAWDKPLAHIYRCGYEAVPGSGGLPKRLTFVPNADLMHDLKKGDFHTVAPIVDSDQDTVVISLAAYYGGISEPEAVYQATAVKDFHGYVLPTGFSFEGFVFIKSKSSKDSSPRKVLSRRILGSVTSMELIKELDPLPRSSDDLTSISVADYRFFNASKHLAFVAYTATNSQWIISETDPYLQRLYLDALSKSSKWVARPQFSRVPVLVAFLLILLLPLLFRPVRRALCDKVIGRTSME